ncbi:MAG: hypothetical protein AB7O62_04925 [Pirellulales bacterium]
MAGINRWAIGPLLILAMASRPALAELELTLELPRTTYQRGEAIPLRLAAKNADETPISGGRVEVQLGPAPIVYDLLPTLQPNETKIVTLQVATGRLRSGEEYPLSVRIFAEDGQPVAQGEQSVLIARKPSGQRLDVWQWCYGGPLEETHSGWKVKPEDLGFTMAGGPVFPYSPPGADPAAGLKAVRPSLERALRRGMDIVHSPVGLWHREYNLVLPRGAKPLVEPRPATGEQPATPPAATVDPTDDTRYQGAGRNGQEYFNPFHPEVAASQNFANRLMMEQMGDFPNLKYAFVDAEFIDDLYYHNGNAGGQRQMQEVLGFTLDEIGKPNYVAPGVLADDDRGLRYHRYVFQRGNGVHLAVERAARTVHRHRPDVKFMSDPFRSVALLDMFPGCDVVSTWTYTNPDPKLMLYVESLRAVCKPAGQQPLHVVTLLNYPGEVIPEAVDKRWQGMGPGRLIETTWINLSRAPQAIGYYALDDRYFGDEFPGSRRTFDALAMLNEKVFLPFGPLLRSLEVAPRKIALLTSDSSRLYNNSPGLLGYPNYQGFHFYTVLAMAHLNADVVFDESIERYGLDSYDVLVLPKCEVLTKTVFDRIIAFQQRGGLVISDQYLAADIPGAVRFDFDFTHRRKVNANAIATGEIYVAAGQDDHLVPGKSEMEKVTGVTARQDQLIMESYAAQLRQQLHDKVDPQVHCDRHDVLINVLEKHGVWYLVLANDRRDYDDITGPHQAVMERLVPQTVNVRVRHKRGRFVPYDLLAGQRLKLKAGEDESSFPVKLGETGGTIIALSPAAIGGIHISAPASMRLGETRTIRLQVVEANNRPVRGQHPLRVEFADPTGQPTEYSDFACTEDGRLSLSFTPALNDPSGAWTITITDLTSGTQAVHAIDLRLPAD